MRAPAVPPGTVPTGTPSAPLSACLQRGEASLNQGQWEKALSWFQQALMHDARAPRAWAGVGDALLELRRWPESAAHFAKAVQIDGDDPDAHFDLGVALAHLNRPVPATFHYTRALRLRPDYAELVVRKRRRVHNHIGTVHVIAICNGLEAAMGELPEERIVGILFHRDLFERREARLLIRA